MNYVEYLHKVSRQSSDKNLLDVADYVEELERKNRKLFLDLKATGALQLTEEQWFDRYGYFC